MAPLRARSGLLKRGQAAVFSVVQTGPAAAAADRPAPRGQEPWCELALRDAKPASALLGTVVYNRPLSFTLPSQLL
ncbi:hypothetical protein NDU88_003388 [Pleurodeles waltl]|uniref:Uncharacterized protein n=1 Tax=Pleurodeles waltl TaxID=8319 RepID=A0AAV7V2B8_PLEWA|nr:hypothetical protein NDU88_003388 [Pleurodeles waltl]